MEKGLPDLRFRKVLETTTMRELGGGGNTTSKRRETRRRVRVFGTVCRQTPRKIFIFGVVQGVFVVLRTIVEGYPESWVYSEVGPSRKCRPGGGRVGRDGMGVTRNTSRLLE